MAEKTLQTLCPSCGHRNRYHPHGDTPHCDKCRKRLFPDRAIAVDDDALNRHLRQDQAPLLIDFWAPGCAPCRMLMPVLDEVARSLPFPLRILKINTAEFPATIKKHQLRAVPTLVLRHKGKELARKSGALGATQLTRWIEQTI